MNKNIVIALVAVAGIALLGGVVLWQIQTQPRTTTEEKPQRQIEQNKDIGGSQLVFTGKVLAGKKVPYLEFNKADYEKAKAEGYLIFMDFYANWCPICRVELPDLYAGFDALNVDKVVGFQVNYNDSETDADEKALARELTVTYQHSKRIIKNGQVVLESAESWDKERVVKEINSLL